MSLKKTFIVFIFTISMVTLSAKEMVHIVFDDTQNTKDEEIKVIIANSKAINTLIKTINKELKLKVNITVVFGLNDGPFYNEKTKRIQIPYSFYTQTFNLFKTADYVKTGISEDEATIDVLMHTILHEFTHAIISIYNIPIIGNHEDVADILASILLIEFFEDGSSIVLSSADLFKLSSNITRIENEDFRGEHSLDIQRFYKSLCLVYGSDPLQYKRLLKDLNYSDYQMNLCVDDYNINVNNWMILIKDYIPLIKR